MTELKMSVSLFFTLLCGLNVCCGLKEILESYKVEFEQREVDESNGPVSGDSKESNGLVSGDSKESNGLVSDKCMRCICMVESRCNNNIGCRMDVGSLSCGPFQIKEAYWIDCGQPKGDYKTCANDYLCSYNCIQAYMARYIGHSGCPKNCESYARIHNGGPRGCTNPNTMGYWNKIKQQGCTIYS
ncbi:Lysozyme 3,Lysozyme 2,Lysozyme 1,Invertebrate-type lysozyme,Lysozyme [Mytilus coruscus]|uniref:lysozyme n=1 Tax=Mytilus coruscus TaxID=42192 RepID=A0A6J8BCM0_MYTCO|nr:Lysozyme 3,Lysozyme 2,Lysozyme 1,Invertebrate-type lysozyme,Lysozyme [Mytilus coruscus]